MAKREQFKLTLEERKRRRFSDSFKREKVEEIDRGKVTVAELSREYEVSTTSIYKWIDKFSNREKKERLIMETESDTRKLKAYKERIAELERLLGQKQIELEYKEKMIELAEELYDIDIKKNCTTQRSDSSG